uniref:Subtilisin-like protease fibronectin type-III domain-containing protein n=1 Tax=Rhizophora mucronata TaxID=61149 RepID=A0A2P2PE49_RHIMU
MTLKPKWARAAKKSEFGWLTWTDGKHHVRSPIAVIGGGYQTYTSYQEEKATFNNRIR